ncbi:MAG: hypothetical protein ACQETR_02150 [Thermodesulfobacteriota bacterium]
MSTFKNGFLLRSKNFIQAIFRYSFAGVQHFRCQAFGGGWQEHDAEPYRFFLPVGFSLSAELVLRDDPVFVNLPNLDVVKNF